MSTAPATPCTVRTLGAHELPWVMDLAAAEGWNPGLHDAAAFFAADPQGFLAVEVAGESVGCISAVRYGGDERGKGDFGFIGLYILQPAWRGRGLGMAMWKAGMARLAGCTVGLDGVPAQQANYQRSGFALAWRNARFEGRVPAAASIAQTANSAALVPLAAVDFDRLCADDRRVFPAPREAFLRSWIEQSDAVGLALPTAGGALAGWGLARRCREGHKIGPLVADSPEAAATVFDGLCARLPAHAPVWLDVALPHADAVALARARGMRPVFETARMYAGPAPAVELDRLYGITTFELG